MVIAKALFRMAFPIAALAFTGQVSAETQEKAYPDPARFEERILKFEQADANQMPPPGAVVCVGSSSMGGWHKHIAEDLTPLTVIPRGFGGSNFNDLMFYSDRIVLKYRPRAILVYEGDNDTAHGIAPEKTATMFASFVSKVHEDLPDCRIYFLAIKPSISRWKIWPEMEKANRLIEAQCRSDDRLNYIDIASGMLGDDGTPRPEIFLDDNLHMNRKGYEGWRDAVRPVLVAQEAGFETVHAPSD